MCNEFDDLDGVVVVSDCESCGGELHLVLAYAFDTTLMDEEVATFTHYAFCPITGELLCLELECPDLDMSEDDEPDFYLN
jgi:hypothetical protein